MKERERPSGHIVKGDNIMQRQPLLRRALLAGASVTIAILALAACTTPEPAETEPTAGGTESAALLAEAYAGTFQAPPSEPVALVEGLKLWHVSCGESVPTCSDPAAATLDAAATVGWDSTLCDGKLNPEGWGSCIRQGIAAGADVISLIGIDCAPVAGPLTEAAEAGIITIAVAARDCDQSGGDALFTAVTDYLPDTSYEEWWKSVGAAQAKWIVGKNDGAAQALLLVFPDPAFGPIMVAGFEEEMAKHEDSSIVATLEIGNADVVSGALVQKFSTALLQNPEINSIVVPIDGWFLSGLAQAIESSGRSDQLAVIGALGSIPTFGLIAEGTGQDATVTWSSSWDGFSVVDTALRVLADQEILPTGLGWQVVDAENNLPAPGQLFSFEPAVDFRAAYLAAWGIG
jgi:ABC-type sugar transport system substrate-binding protein